MIADAMRAPPPSKLFSVDTEAGSEPIRILFLKK
jgi:hypothetical protein